MKSIRFWLFVAATAAVTTPALAQFSDDPTTNTLVADRANQQAQPKISVAPDGSMYVAWFDNAAGGYDVYLQRLSAAGQELWKHNGVLVADRSYSSTQDYDLRVDAAGNALLAFNDNRSGTDQITVAKVASDGSMPWGAAGVTVSTGTASKGFPRVTALSNGTIMAAWSENFTCKFQALAADGAPVGALQTIEEAGHGLTLTDIQPGNDGTFIAMWNRGFTLSFSSAKYIYSQKFDAAFAPMWTVTPGAAAVVVYGPTGTPYPSQGGSLGNGYFPTFLSDGHGGAVYGWYEGNGTRNAYVQQITSSGVVLFQANGLPVTVENPGFIKTSAGLSYDVATGDIFLAWTETNASSQSTFTLGVQKISNEGTREWGDAGRIVIPTNSNQTSFVRTIAYQGGCYVACFDARSATTGVVAVTRLAADGSSAWDEGVILACSRETGKSRLDVARSASGEALLVWSDGPTSAADVYMQNVKPDGSLGNPPSSCPADFNHDGFANSQDFFDFLVPFFAADPAADFNKDGFVNSQDFFDYVTVFFAGC